MILVALSLVLIHYELSRFLVLLSGQRLIVAGFVLKSSGAEIKRELKNIDSFPHYRGISITRTVEGNSKPFKFVKVKLT